MNVKTNDNKYAVKFIQDLGTVVSSVESDYPAGTRNKWNVVKKELEDMGWEVKELSNERLFDAHRFHHKGRSAYQSKNVAEREDKLAGLSNLDDRILKRISKKTEVGALAAFLGVTSDDILLAATKLKLSGHTNIKVFMEGSKTFIQYIKKYKRLDNEFNKIDEMYTGQKEITIGVISDTHCGSEYHANEELHKMYDIFEQRGIKMVLHAGDLSEGFKKSRAETFLGNTAIGFQPQLEYVVKNYPRRKGITTYAINGNHDLWYLQEGLANFVNTAAIARDDIRYLGDDFARVWITPKVDITLYHPNDGSSSNVFTKLQNFGDRGGNKLSKINIIGHYHKLGWIYYRDMHILYPASFQRQSDWMNINNLASILGGLILTLKLRDDGSLKDLVIEHVLSFD